MKSFLNTKEIKKIHSLLKERFGFNGNLDYIFHVNKKNRIFIINKELSQVDLSKLRINSVGLYFGELHKTEVRLSIEGSQIIGKNCSKNIVELDEKESKEWLKGMDINKKHEKGYVLLKHKDDFLGCGKALGDVILNFVPKNRRVKSSD